MYFIHFYSEFLFLCLRPNRKKKIIITEIYIFATDEIKQITQDRTKINKQNRII